MITDVFYKRYPDIFYFYQGVPTEVAVFLRQGMQIIFYDLKPFMDDTEELCRAAYMKLTRELGYGIYNGKQAEEICIGALCELHNLWNNAHGTPEEFVRHRLSLLELLLAEVETEFDYPDSNSVLKQLHTKHSEISVLPSNRKDALKKAVQEINHRFREANIPLHYHNRMFQYCTDQITESEVHEPFWEIVKDKKWQNIDIDIKEAIDRRDKKGRDAALYALKALESTIKIISDDNKWSRGTERGAANYIDNLVSADNGKFIDVWESQHLKTLFRDLRNPHGHGPGSAPQPILSEYQENWIIECSMIWIKSLIRRTF